MNMLILPSMDSFSISVIAATVSFFVTGTYYYLKYTYSYWERKGVKGPKPIPFIGHIHKILSSKRQNTEKEWVKQYGKVYGIYQGTRPRLVVADPEVLKQICIKDFDIFPNHYVNEFINKYQKSFLIFMEDDHWKKVRAMMSPTFTSGKIKRMFKFLDACADDLASCFQEQLPISQVKNGDEKNMAIVNVKELYSLFTMDAITTCCYGLKLERNGSYNLKTMASRNDFVHMCLKLFEFSPTRLIASMVVPKIILRLVKFELSTEAKIKPLVKRCEELISRRRNAPKSRKFDDYLQLLIDARLEDEMELNDMDAKENHHAGLTHESLLEDQRKMIDQVQKENNSLKVELTDLEVIGSAAFLLLVGLETTGSLLTSCTYALAFHQDIQEKLYEELMKIAEYNEDKTKLSFNYDELTSCQYLDAVLSETLRLMAPVYTMDRVAKSDYRIEKYNVDIPKGAVINLALYGILNNDEFWPNPDKFDPDRFSPENREKIVSGSYCPFGVGPRHCLGMRFSLTEAKLALARVATRFQFKPAPGTSFPPESKRHPALNGVKNPKVVIVPRN